MVLTLLKPEWPVPAHIAALVSTRSGGVSAEPFDSLNLATHVNDEPAAVAVNRCRLIDAAPGLAAIGWLQQVHGVAVVAADAAHVPVADALYTTTPGLGCAPWRRRRTRAI